MRHLGRHGVLSMNVISQMSKLTEVRQVAAHLAKTAEFDTGARYVDYQAGDKKAEYGLAGLVAAGLGVGAAKKGPAGRSGPFLQERGGPDRGGPGGRRRLVPEVSKAQGRLIWRPIS